MELLKAGVKNDVAERALDDVYDAADSLEVARRLAMKQAARLRKLDPLVARRRLVGMLQRRGFEYEAIKPATRFGALTLRYGLALIPGRLAWLEDAMKELSR